jgi:hypothetical protein
MRRLIEQSGSGSSVLRALGQRARDWLALTAIFLLVPLVGLTALFTPPWAVDRVTAPLWHTVWSPIGSALTAYHEAPALEAAAQPAVAAQAGKAPVATPAANHERTRAAAAAAAAASQSRAIALVETELGSPAPPELAPTHAATEPTPESQRPGAVGEASSSETSLDPIPVAAGTPRNPDEDEPGGGVGSEAGLDGSAAGPDDDAGQANSAQQDEGGGNVDLGEDSGGDLDPDEDSPPGCGQGATAPGCGNGGGNGNGNGGNDNPGGNGNAGGNTNPGANAGGNPGGNAGGNGTESGNAGGSGNGNGNGNAGNGNDGNNGSGGGSPPAVPPGQAKPPKTGGRRRLTDRSRR